MVTHMLLEGDMSLSMVIPVVLLSNMTAILIAVLCNLRLYHIIQTLSYLLNGCYYSTDENLVLFFHVDFYSYFGN